MKYTVLITFLLLSNLFALSQTLPLLKAHSYYQVGPGGSISIGDSLIHLHSNGRNSTAKPTANNFYYPKNGVFNDDSTVSFDVINGGVNMAYYSRKFNAAGLPTVYTKDLAAFIPGPHYEQIFYKYTAQMLTDTISQWAGGVETSRKVHEYQNGKLTGIRGYYRPSASSAWLFTGVDSFIAAGPGSDSSYIVYQWNGSSLVEYKRNTYVRDAANRILTDSTFNNGNLLYIRRCSYNTAGRLTVDSTFSWVSSQSQFEFASKTNYLYDAQANLTGIKQSNWYSVTGTFVGVEVDSFSFNQHHQITKFMRYDSTASGRVPISGTTAQFFYYDTTLHVDKIAAQNTLQLYPVPATSYINLAMQFTKPQPFSVRIFDMQGRLINNWQEPAQKNYSKQIPLTGMAPGQYTLHIWAGDESCSKQFMVVR